MDALEYEERRLPSPDGRAYASRRLELLRRTPYRAAVPPRIAESAISLPDAVLARADDASAALTRFDASTSAFPAPFTAVLLRTESASSSQIEHLTAGPRAIAEAVIGERVEGNAPLIVSNVRAMEAALALADSISGDAIIAMHDALLRDTEPGMVGGFRTEQVWIGGQLPHNAQFVPPHHERVAEAMDDLVRFTARRDLPVLAQAAIAHAQFETIHPFLDGNGRIGRLLIPLYLISHGVLAKPSLYLSDFFERHRASYYDALMRVRVGNDLMHWVRFFLQGVAETATKGREVFRQILALRTDAEQRILSLGKRVPNARAALELLYRTPMVAASDLERRLEVSKPTAHALVRDLERLGLLTETTGQMRDRLYVFDAYLGFFLS